MGVMFYKSAFGARGRYQETSPRKRHLNVLRVKAVGTALVPVLQEQEKQSLRTQEGKTGVP